LLALAVVVEAWGVVVVLVDIELLLAQQVVVALLKRH
jgi:hypothetical protein